MTNCRAPPKKVQAEPLASRGDISSNPRKQYANGEAGEREEPMLRNQLPPSDGGEVSFQRRLTNGHGIRVGVVRGDTSTLRRCLIGKN